jgi:hypothetical protein
MEDKRSEEEKILDNSNAFPPIVQKCSLFRSDGLKKHSTDYLWLEFNEDGRFKEKHKECAIGRSLILAPFNPFFVWQTTEVIEIIEEKENYTKFRTKNSEYELIIKQNGE